jgi:sec-independent protein translocase protein TatA
MFGKGIGWPEIILILAVVLLLFGAKRLPDTARGLGRSLRIFKAETKGLTDDDASPAPPTAQPTPAPPPTPEVPPTAAQTEVTPDPGGQR